MFRGGSEQACPTFASERRYFPGQPTSLFSTLEGDTVSILQMIFYINVFEKIVWNKRCQSLCSQGEFSPHTTSPAHCHPESLQPTLLSGLGALLPEVECHPHAHAACPAYHFVLKESAPQASLTATSPPPKCRNSASPLCPQGQCALPEDLICTVVTCLRVCSPNSQCVKGMAVSCLCLTPSDQPTKGIIRISKRISESVSLLFYSLWQFLVTWRSRM